MKVIKDYINLLPQDETNSSPSASRGILLIILVSLLLLGVFGWQVKQLGVLKGRLATLTTQKQALQQQGDAIRKTLGISPGTMGLGKAALIKNLLRERVVWSKVFKELSLIVPKGLWFDSLEGVGGDKAEMKIKGGAFTYTAVSEFMVSMQKTGYFEAPQLSYAQKVVVRGKDVVGFEIICGMTKTQGAR
jgi:Tfp pilus assembly protein PilN